MRPMNAFQITLGYLVIIGSALAPVAIGAAALYLSSVMGCSVEGIIGEGCEWFGIPFGWLFNQMLWIGTLTIVSIPVGFLFGFGWTGLAFWLWWRGE